MHDLFSRLDSQASHCSTTSTPSAPTTSSPSTSSAPATRASRSLSPDRVAESLIRGIFGPNVTASLANYDHASRSWKTSQGIFLWGSETFSETLPRMGTMRSGSIYALPTWAHPSDASGSSLWPTPTVAMSRNRTCVRKNPQSAHHDGVTLSDAFHMLGLESTEMSPDWVSCLMGFPIGWTVADGQPAREKSSTTGSRRARAQKARTARLASSASVTPSYRSAPTSSDGS